MNRKINLSIFVCLGALMSAWAETPPPKEKVSLKEVLYRRNGGTLIQPHTGSGQIVYVNAQKRAPQRWLEENAAVFAKTLQLSVSVATGDFKFPNPKRQGEATLFVIDDPSMPSILHAPEQRWTMVNVAPLAEGRGEKPAFFAARVQKELTRGFALLAGAQTSNYPDSLLGSMTKPDDLDSFADCRLPVDILRRFAPYLKGFGIKPYIKSTYRRACREGWAPAPTNAVQQAIWDKMQAEKERGPTNGLQIPPPKK